VSKPLETLHPKFYEGPDTGLTQKSG